MSYVPTGGGAEVTSTPNSGIVVSSGNILSSGLVAGTSITLTPDSSFGGKGLRIDATGGGGGIASVTSSNGSGINAIASGANINLTSALAAGSGIALIPSGVAKTLTISNTQSVASAGNGSGISTSVVGGQTNISTNLIAGTGIVLTPSGLNSSITVAAPAAASAVQSVSGSTNITSTGGTTPTISLVPDVVLPTNGSLTVNRTAGPLNSNDIVEFWDTGSGYFVVGTDGTVGRWNATTLPGSFEWFITPAGDGEFNTVKSDGLAQVGSLTSAGAIISSSANLGALSSSTLAVSGTASTGALTATAASTPSLTLTPGNCVLTSSAGSNAIQVATPSAGNQTLAYLSDIPAPPATPTLELVLNQGNIVGGAIGIVYAPDTGGGTPAFGTKLSGAVANYTACLTNNDGSPNSSILSLDNDIKGSGTGTLRASNVSFANGDPARQVMTGGVVGNRITVAATGQPLETIAYLSDITGGGGGVQSVSAGSANIVIGGTATNPTVDLGANPTISGTLVVNGGNPNLFKTGIVAPGFQLFNNPGGAGNLGVVMTTPSSGVCSMIGSDGTSACQLRVNGTTQLVSGASTATLSTTNGNLNVNNVRALVQTTGLNYLGIQTSTVAPGTITLTAANFGQTLLYDLNASGTLTINLPTINPGTVPLGSFINIGRQVNDSTSPVSIVVKQSIGSPTTDITISATNQMLTFILTGFSSTTPLYHCLGGF